MRAHFGTGCQICQKQSDVTKPDEHQKTKCLYLASQWHFLNHWALRSLDKSVAFYAAFA